MSHVYNGDTIVRSGESMILFCPLCDERTLHSVSYGGMVCHVCRCSMSDFNDFSSLLPALMRREGVLMGWNVWLEVRFL